MDFATVFGSCKPAPLNVEYPYSFHHVINVFLEFNNLDFDTTGIFAYWVTQTMITADGAFCPPAYIAPTVQGTPDAKTGHGITAVIETDPAVILSSIMITDVDDVIRASTDKKVTAEEAMLGRKFFELQNPCIGIMKDLVACWQIKPLSSESLLSYFKMNNSDSIKPVVLTKILNASAHKISKIVGNIDANLSDNPFIGYHTSVSSTPSLCIKAFNDLGPLRDTLFTVEEITAVREAYKAQYDYSLSIKISPRTISVVHAYLKATDNVPDNWYQGDKAVSNTVKAAYTSYVNFFKHLNDKLYSISKTTIHNSVPLIMYNAPAGLAVGIAYKEDAAKNDDTIIADKRAEMNEEKLILINEKRKAQSLSEIAKLPLSMRVSVKEAIAQLEIENQ